jgi:hypothetical protein
MKIDALKQYAKLRLQLQEEKKHLEARLAEINEVLTPEADLPAPSLAAQSPAVPTLRRGRRRRNKMTMREAVMQALSKGALTRKELAEAVQNEGYVFRTRNPLNSLGAILYAKNSPIRSQGGKFSLTRGAAAPVSTSVSNGEPPKKRRKWSAAARAKLSQAQKQRWARARAGQ